MSIVREFKDFATKGNFLDLAVGVIIGAASGEVVKSLVEKVIMPPIGLVLGKVAFGDLKVVLQEAVRAQDGKDDAVKEVAIAYGAAIQTLVNFLVIAFIVFLVVRAFNRFKKAAPAPEAPAQEKLLTEIRDLLRSSS